MFDEKNIVLTFSLMSDIHISGSWYIAQSKKLFINALDYSRQVAKNPIDAYVFAGDFVDCMNSKPNVLLGENWGFDYNEAKAKQSAQEFKSLREVFRNNIPNEAEIIYCLGNHDSSDCNNTERFIKEFSSLDEIGDGKNFERMYRTDLDLESMKNGMRHCVCKGYHFLCVDIVSDFTKTGEFLKKNLEEITQNEPDKYVFVVSHFKAPNTNYASNADQCEMSLKLGELLKNYSQVIHLTGHTHTTLYNERAIMQKEYTSLESSCVGYVAPSWAGKELNVTGEIKYSASEGLVLEIDQMGNVRITRLDFANCCTIKTPWEISAPVSDNSHLLKYTNQRINDYKAFEFPENAEIILESCDNGTKIVIPKVTADQGGVFRYQVTCYNNFGEAEIFIISSLFCYINEPEYKEDCLTAVIPKNTEDIYKVSVRAQDFWFNEGESLVKFNI